MPIAIEKTNLNESRSCEKLPMVTAPRKPDLKELEFWADGMHSLGEVVSPSQKKPDASKREEDSQTADSRLIEEAGRGYKLVGFITKDEMARVKERKEDVEDLLFRCEEQRIAARKYAIAAVSYLRKKEGLNLELVKPGTYEVGGICKGIRVHFNFKVKRADLHGAPVETYFCQLRDRANSDMVIECCVSLGESASLPYERDNRGCQYCTQFVHHPVGRPKGMKFGVVTWSEKKMTFVVS